MMHPIWWNVFSGEFSTLCLVLAFYWESVSDRQYGKRDCCTAITAQQPPASTLLNTRNMIPFNAENDLKNLLQVHAFVKKKKEKGGKKKVKEKRGEKEREGRKRERERRKKVDLGKLCLLARSPPGCVFYTDSESVLSHLSDNAFIIKFHICI